MMPVVGVAGSFRGRRWLIRVFGWLGLAVVVPVLVRVRGAQPRAARARARADGPRTGPVILNRNVDLLFLVDDSSSMRRRRTTCCGTFPC